MPPTEPPTEPPTGRRCRRPSPPCCPQSCPRRGKATAAKRAAVLLAWLGFGLSGRFSRPFGVLVVLLVWRLSFGLAVSAFRLFFSGPLSPRIKKKTKSRSLPALSGVCLFVVCAAVVCRLCCSCLSFVLQLFVILHRLAPKQRQKAFLFWAASFLLCFASLASHERKRQKAFLFWAASFLLFLCLPRGWLYTYIYIPSK